jgi:hypothetical protein
MLLNDIKTDQVKKKILVYYLSYGERQMWEQMSKYKTGTYAEFQDQVLSFHPQAQKQAKRDLTHLKLVCAPYMNLQQRDFDSLVEFHLMFRHEAKKLEGTIVSNQKLAEIYLGALEEGFCDQVLDAMA